MKEETIYTTYSKLNPYNNIGLENFEKFIKTTKYYFVPKFLNKIHEDKWVASFRLSKYLLPNITKQIYYDLVHLGLNSKYQRPKCNYCGEHEAKFVLHKGYYSYCPKCRYKHTSSLVSKKLKGKPLSEENKRNLSLAKKGKKLTEEQRLRRPRGYHFHHSQATKDKLSAMKKGKVKSRSYYKSGIFISKRFNKNIEFLSSFEENFLNICENSKYVVSIDIPDPIIYKHVGEVHRYYPDFLIELDSGTKIIVEIKCFNLINDKKVIDKRLYAKKFCRTSNMQYITLTEKDIFKFNKKYKRKELNNELYFYDYLYK